jgi:hypothetical protein
LLDPPGASLADGNLGCGCNLAQRLAVLLELVHLVVRDPLAGHRKPPNNVLQLTVPASRTCPAPVTTGQDSCRRPAKLIVVSHGPGVLPSSLAQLER